MIVYKLTNQNLQTHGGYQWARVAQRGRTAGAICAAPAGCTTTTIRCWPGLQIRSTPTLKARSCGEAEAEGLHRDDKGQRGGCTRLYLIRQIDLPQITTEHVSGLHPLRQDSL